MNKKEKMYIQIEKHGNDLNAIFHTDLQPIVLCKKLRRIERKVHHAARMYCNGIIQADEFGKVKDTALNQLDKILECRAKGIPVFINSDPRGYALKIDNKYMRENNIDLHRDLGGYGIIAPDYTPE